MKLLPSEDFTIQTQDSIEIVYQKILVQVKDSRIILSSQEQAYFKGQVTERGFKISRIVNEANIFFPIICGRFEDVPDGAVIHISMELNSLITRIFHTIYLSFYLSLAMISILKLLVDFDIVVISSSVSLSLKSIPSELTASLVLGSFLLVLLITRNIKNSFWNEVKLTRKKLTQICLG